MLVITIPLTAVTVNSTLGSLWNIFLKYNYSRNWTWIPWAEGIALTLIGPGFYVLFNSQNAFYS